MEFILPSLLLLLAAAFIVYSVLPKTTPLVLTFVAVIALVLTAKHHYDLFSGEYKFMTMIDAMKSNAPMWLVALVIIMVLGYIFASIGMIKFGSGSRNGGNNTLLAPRPSNNRPPSNRPPNITQTQAAQSSNQDIERYVSKYV